MAELTKRPPEGEVPPAALDTTATETTGAAQDRLMTLAEHIEELRRRLFISLLAVGATSITHSKEASVSAISISARACG